MFQEKDSLPETNSEFTPENGWLDDKPSFCGNLGLFSGANLLRFVHQKIVSEDHVGHDCGCTVLCGHPSFDLDISVRSGRSTQLPLFP